MLNNTFTNIVSAYIKEHHLLDRKSTHLVALSGGADSVSLLRVLLSLNYNVVAAHCNFHLRDQESERDELFCWELCKALDVNLHVTHFDTKAYSQKHHVSIEMAAREQRYQWFQQLIEQHHYASICVAHHADDAIETMFINILRGTGIHGLTGIRPCNGHVVRPLLCVSHDDILSYLSAIRQVYVTDSSNQVPDVWRNKIRLHLMPVLEDINPHARASLRRSMNYLAKTSEVIDKMMTTRKSAHLIQIFSEKGEHLGGQMKTKHITDETFLFFLLQPYHFNSSQVEEIWSKLVEDDDRHYSKQKQWCSADGCICILSRDSLYLWENKALKNYVISICNTDERCTISPTTISLPNNTLVLQTRLFNVNDWKTDIPRTANIACLDINTLAFPLTLRPWQHSDRFQPFGMKGTQLVSDFLTNQRVNPIERKLQYVLTDANGVICWIVGRRIAHHCRITDQTRWVAELSVDD